MTKRALITGITGQDGSYLAELLLDKGYDVHGLVRRIAIEDQITHLGHIRHLLPRLTLHPASLESYPSLFKVISDNAFDECYHFAGQSFVAESFADGFTTMSVNISGTHYLLSAFKDLQPRCRFYFAASSEMFGKVSASPQDEQCRFHPRSPYGISKVAGFYLCQNYRESHDMHCSSGILFNHESPRRGLQFVTRKITSTAARIKLGLADELALGNLDAERDWGHARDYVEAIYRIVQHPQPEDFVVATGKTHTVRDFCKLAFEHLDLDYEKYVKVDQRFFRPAEAEPLKGDAGKAARLLGWKPAISFEDLVAEMVRADYERIRENTRNGRG